MSERTRLEREHAMLERIEVRVSPIHGKGVFARRRLRAGQLIGRFEGDTTTNNGTYVLWLIDEDGGEVGIRGRNALRFLNHGDPEYSARCRSHDRLQRSMGSRLTLDRNFCGIGT